MQTEAAALLEGLNEAQRRAVTSDAAPLAILAGAGSGKTRVLTRRIAYRCASGTADARHVLALTFTRKAAGELESRLRSLGLRERVSAGTFHATAYAQLRSRWADRNVAPPGLLERKGRLLARLLGRGPVRPADVAGEIEWAKARMIRPEHYATEAGVAGRRPPLEPAAMAQLYERYEHEKRAQRLVDFDDLLWLCAQALESDAEFGDAQRWRFRHLFVDEFQDVNPLQFRLLTAWRGSRRDLCVVGDPNQAIYAWNGADPTLLTGLARRIPGTETVSLEQNYRSSPEVIASANRILECGAVPGLRLRATQPNGPVPTVRSHATDRHEARAIARAALDRHGPSAPWSHQAVLTRTNAQAVLLAEVLRGAGVPCRVRGQMPFLELPEVKEALRVVQRARGSLHEALADLESRLAAGGDGDPELLEATVSDAEASRIRNLEELLRLGSEYLADERHPTAAGFTSWLVATVANDEVQGTTDVVDIVTFHAAKGLEWPIVHLAGIESGLVPSAHARTSEALAEERRLFYVAVTRAERELHMTWAEERTFGTKVARRKPSPYLEDLEPLLAALESGTAPADAAQHLPAARQAVNAARANRSLRKPTVPVESQPLFDALRQWRSQRAKAANTPAFVIFDDKTLTEIATRRPHDRPGLLAVPGIGPVKVERYGEDILAMVAAH
jgi:DNA helicase-2/ATP-dependent DNA helicase PcrA